MTSHAAARPGLKQETIAIVAVGVTMLGTMLYTTSSKPRALKSVSIALRPNPDRSPCGPEFLAREILRLTRTVTSCRIVRPE